MKYHLSDRIVRELCSFAQKYAVTKIVLFGSRARGTNTERSDVDIAVYGGDFDSFYWDVKENKMCIRDRADSIIVGQFVGSSALAAVGARCV